MRTILIFLMILFAGTSCSLKSVGGRAERILFVGNSLTYVGNVPAVYAALATANGYPTQSDMIVSGGATLAQRVSDGSVKRALSQGSYSVLVIQERGGDLICSFGPDSCIQSRSAVNELASLARENGLKVVFIGTYQPNPISSRKLVDAESAAAKEAGILYAEVSENLRKLREAEPDLVWFAEDGMHPGRELALLNAMLIYHALHGTLPAARALQVVAPIYGTTSGLDEELRRAGDPPPLPVTPGEISYSSDTLAALLRVIGSAGN